MFLAKSKGSNYVYKTQSGQIISNDLIDAVRFFDNWIIFIHEATLDVDELPTGSISCMHGQYRLYIYASANYLQLHQYAASFDSRIPFVLILSCLLF